MRGSKPTISPMFYAINLDERVRPDHALWAIRVVVDAILREMEPLLAACYSSVGRPGVPQDRRCQSHRDEVHRGPWRSLP